jgi:hypothetical protein
MGIALTSASKDAGSRETKWAAMVKTIYSLPALRELLEAANRRYLEFLSAILRGEFNINGLQNKTLRCHLNSGQTSRLLKRLRNGPGAKSRVFELVRAI